MRISPELERLLPYLLRPDNVASYSDGVVSVGDRSRYPFERSFVRCADVEQVARAIRGMVTQGAGPWVAAAYAMVGVARRCASGSKAEVVEQLERARDHLVATRPTNTTMARTLSGLLQAARELLDQGGSLEEQLLSWVDDRRQRYYQRSFRMAEFAADLVEDGDGVLTMCFAEAPFVLAMALARQRGKAVRVYAPETRPYLQGARLTAPSLQELAVPVTLITDNMPAHLMAAGMVQKYFTAADLVTMDGHVVNKVGTFLCAIAANHHGVPYYAFSGGPDPGRPDRQSIVLEERDPAEVRACRGLATTMDQIECYYPAFDITPPELVRGIVTELGVLKAGQLSRSYPTS